MASPLATTERCPHSVLEDEAEDVERRTSLLDVSNQLICSMQHKRRLSSRLAGHALLRQSRRRDKRSFYQFAMPIHEDDSRALSASTSRAFVRPTAGVARQAALVLSPSTPEQARLLNVGSPINQRRNVYVCGHKMAVKQGTKPIGSIKKRSRLNLRRARLTDCAVILAISGLIMAMIDAELLAERVYEENHYASVTLRSIIIIMTCMLLVLIVWYHITEVQILLLDSSTRDYCVVITMPRVAQCALELCICSICPIPATLFVPYARLIEIKRTEVVRVAIGGILTTAMFLRLYLLCRFTAFRSRQFRDAGTRTVASIIRIPIDFAFVIKTLMFEYPLTVLLTIWVGFAISISLMFVQCERQGDSGESAGYLNAVWFTMATLMSNGYGDTVPHTYCGRALSIITSLVGIGITASLVAVMKRKLQLSQAERRVNEFVTDSRLAREKKHAAAVVLQQTWFIHKCINGTTDCQKLRMHQRRFLHAINEFRRVKFEQRIISDNNHDLSEITHIQKGLKQLMAELQARHVQSARLALFLTKQLEQLRKSVEQWQKIRADQAISQSNFEDSGAAQSVTAVCRNEKVIMGSVSSVGNAGTDRASATVTKRDSFVVPGAIVDFACGTTSLINEEQLEHW